MNFFRLPMELVDKILEYENIYEVYHKKVIRNIVFAKYRYNMWVWSKFYNKSFYEYVLEIDVKKIYINNIKWRQINQEKVEN